jgi:4-amino-4-deoxy-L-arabinose transferase-like glycosyltransferase
MFVAVLFRTVNLGTAPPGLSADEALNGNEALQAHDAGQYPLFYPLNNGREGLFLNLIGLSEAIFGVGFLSLRIPAAVAGSLTVLFVYLLGREMVGWRAAIFGSFLLATSFWHVALSRTGFRAILVPLLLTSSLFLLVRALREESLDGNAGDGLWLALAGGLLYGLGFHSYIAYRITPVVVLAFAGADLYRRRRWRESVRPRVAVMAVWCGAAAFVALPMGMYFLNHPAEFFHRMNQLSPLGRQHPVMRIWGGILMAVMQFNVRGDSDWGTNISSAPLLLWPVGLLFLLGIGLALWTLVRRRTGRTTAGLLLLWLVTMLVPTALSYDTSALRTIGDVTPVFLLAGWGAAWIYERLRSRWACGLFLAALLAIGVTEGYRYFVVWDHSPGTADDLHAQVAQTGLMLSGLPPETPRYMVVDRDDDDLRIAYRNPTGSEIALPYTAGVVVLETRQHRLPIFLFEDEAAHTRFPPGSVLVQMYPSDDFFPRLRAQGVQLRTGVRDGVPYAVIQ